MVMHRAKTVSVFAAIAVLVLGLGGCFLFAPTGTVSGTVYDSTAGGAGLAGVQVSVLDSSHSTTTDIYGDFSVEAPVGFVTLRFAKQGYTFADIVVEVTRGIDSDTLVSIVGYDELTYGQYRFILTWAENPSDIDSHLVLPGETEEVYFGNKVASDSSANLDWDDVDSYGPETITIDTVNPGTYTYYVYKFSGVGDMGAVSDAVVQVYDSTGLIKTLKIEDAPNASTSAQLYWRVFTFDGAFHWINQLADAGY